MHKKYLDFLFVFILAGCASTNKSADDAIFIDKASPECTQTATLNSSGFSLIPPVATAIAKSMLLENAKKYNSNRVLIIKQTGTFMVEIEAIGYMCPVSK